MRANAHIHLSYFISQVERLPHRGSLSLFIFISIYNCKTWSEARIYCRDHYTDLANGRNQTENQRIFKTAGGGVWVGLYRNRIWSNRQNTTYQNWRPQMEMNRLINTVRGTYFGSTWIGLYDDMNSWKWSLDNTALDGGFKSWFVQQPVNSYGQSLCVYMSYNQGTWSEAFCSSRSFFVCYDGMECYLNFNQLFELFFLIPWYMTYLNCFCTGRANASTSYVMVYQYKTWTEAQSYCREHHTGLVSIRNEIENYSVQSLITFYSVVWIGLYRTRYWSDQSNSSFSNWKTGQPDNAGNSEYCTAASFSDSGNWTDENCNTALPFIHFTLHWLVAV